MPAEPVLEARSLSVRFGGVKALDGVDFTARRGEISSLIGPNGAGKTTLLNAVSGLVDVFGGTILLAGGEITGLPPHRRGLAGVVRTFQNLEIHENMNVVENVQTGTHRLTRYSVLDSLLKTPRYWREEKKSFSAAMRALEFVGLADAARSPAGDLPFGNQRLLELARALAAGPELLLLDEPAAGLNMRETKTLGALISRIRDELHVSVALVEHDMDLVMSVSDTVTVLSFGRVIAAGEPGEVQKNPEVVAAYLGEEEADAQT